MKLHPIFSFIGTAFLILFLFRLILPTPKYNNQVNNYDRNIVLNEDAASGLDLQGLSQIVGRVKTAQELEQKINQPGGINNLDLNDDGNVDYINVTEYGNQEKGHGFSLVTKLENNETQEIADIQITPNGNQAQVQIRGNESIYGPNYGFFSFHTLSSFLLWSYILSPHRFYSSPYRYGYYPSTYSPYRTTSYDNYQNRGYSWRNSGTKINDNNKDKFTKPSQTLSSPNKNKNASQGIKKSIRNPTATQKQFGVRKTQKTIAKGGFGRSTGNSAKKSYSSSKSFSSARGYSGRSSFGGFGK